MLIHITEEDICLGVRKSQTHCPIGLALRKAFPKSHVRVSSHSVTMGTHIFVPGSDVVKFISDFDSKIPVQPFSFDVNYREIQAT